MSRRAFLVPIVVLALAPFHKRRAWTVRNLSNGLVWNGAAGTWHRDRRPW